MATHSRAGQRLGGTARCRIGARAWQEAGYTNLSMTGCFLQIDETDLAEGSTIWLKIGELSMIEARVEWSGPGQVAVEFASPLHVAVVDHIRRLAG